MQRLKSSPTLPKTSAPYPSLYQPYLEKMSRTGEPILIICPSKKMSGTVRSAEAAALDFPNADIRIIDTNTIGSGLGSIVRQAVAWQKAGLSADQIEQNIKEMSARNRTYFLVDTLEYLHKGGRIGAAQALVGSMLQMKPILCLKDGQVAAHSTERTRKKAMAKFLDLILAECPKSQAACVTIQHGGVPEQAETLAADLKARLGVKDIPIYYLPPAVMVHGGPGVLGVSFFV
ncbi:MAG: DegV family protein [Chloroflexota bacterium]